MRILITGGNGFIGTNAAIRFSKQGHNVVVFDNFDKRFGINPALKDLEHFINGDLRNQNDIENIFYKKYYDTVFHCGAQTAVTHSISNPKKDFETNLLGTFNLLEAIRKYNPETKLIFSSTNKVYGDLPLIPLTESIFRYEFKHPYDGIDEKQPLNFYTPYGCSKGAADQYVLDYTKTYGLNAIVLRKSCIYGPHQDGTKDQGWIAWFTKAMLKNFPITIYGSGKQVRDILYVDDLLDLYEILLGKKKISGVYNIGGGESYSISLIELLTILGQKLKIKPNISYKPKRFGDQKIFISDIRKAKRLGWEPSTNINDGLDKLIDFMRIQ